MLKKVARIVKENYGIILVIILAPLVLGVVIPWVRVDNGSNDGWLGFWGGYLASIITIVGVYWQVRKQGQEAKENMQYTFEQQARQDAKKARPRFTVEVTREKLLNQDFFLNISPDAQPENFMEWVAKSDSEYAIVKIENVSDEVIVNARVKFIYRQDPSSELPDKMEWIIVREIKPHETFLYVPKGTQTASLDAESIHFIDLWVLTSTGETVNYRMIDNYNNGMFNVMSMVSNIDSPGASNFSDYPARHVFDGVGLSKDYD